MIRARAERRGGRPVRLVLLMMAGIALLAACQTGPSFGPSGTPRSGASETATDTPAGSAGPAATPIDSAPPTSAPGATPTGGAPASSPGTSAPSAACSGSEAHREFFRQAAASMAWPVYCAVLPDGWFLETGAYRLADGGRLEVTYRGPAGARLSIVEGNVCGDLDLDGCAPRDAVIGTASFGDREGELGRLANGFVLDVDRGSVPSWRVTGIGLSEDEFRALSAALLVASG